jgi:hypothetical protein
MTSRIAEMRRILRALEGVLADLPLSPEALEERTSAALRDGQAKGACDALEDSTISTEAIRAFARRANERAALLGGAARAESARGETGRTETGSGASGPAWGRLDVPAYPSAGDIQLSAQTAASNWLVENLTPVCPAVSVEASLEDLRSELVQGVVERLGDHVEDLRAALSPVQAPRDADWAGSALESLGVGQEVARSWARPSRAPGWLWARIRRDVEEAKTAVRARRVPVALAAATVVLSASLAVALLQSRGAGDEAGPQITFFRVDRPLSDQYAPTALLQRLRDGR